MNTEKEPFLVIKAYNISEGEKTGVKFAIKGNVNDSGNPTQKIIGLVEGIIEKDFNGQGSKGVNLGLASLGSAMTDKGLTELLEKELRDNVTKKVQDLLK